MRAKVMRLTVAGPEHLMSALAEVASDLEEAGGVETFDTSVATELNVVVELAPEEPQPPK